jgi:hypothetical protein
MAYVFIFPVVEPDEVSVSRQPQAARQSVQTLSVMWAGCATASSTSLTCVVDYARQQSL